MANVKSHKVIGGPFSNEVELVRVPYEFLTDGGAIGVLNLMTAQGAIVIKGFYALVKTACTSAGSAVVDCGVVAVDTNVLLADEAVAGLTLNAIKKVPLVEGTPNVIPMPLYVADGGIVAMEIKTAALTAGKIEFVFEIARA